MLSAKGELEPKSAFLQQRVKYCTETRAAVLGASTLSASVILCFALRLDPFIAQPHTRFFVYDFCWNIPEIFL